MTDVRRLDRGDVATLRRLNAMFAAAFDDSVNYASAPPNDAYLTRLLASPSNVVVVAINDEEVVGGLIAYQLDKFEQVRSGGLHLRSRGRRAVSASRHRDPVDR